MLYNAYKVWITQSQRKHTMGALTHLAKFLGIYKQWREITQNHDLKWQSKQVFNVPESTNIIQMIEYLREIRSIVTRDIWHTFLFDTLTGLDLMKPAMQLS